VLNKSRPGESPGTSGIKKLNFKRGNKMSNMSYCRFQNTLHDLQDCFNEMEENFDFSELSSDEKSAFKSLIELCKDVSNMGTEILDEQRDTK